MIKKALKKFPGFKSSSHSKKQKEVPEGVPEIPRNIYDDPNKLRSEVKTNFEILDLFIKQIRTAVETTPYWETKMDRDNLSYLLQKSTSILVKMRTNLNPHFQTIDPEKIKMARRLEELETTLQNMSKEKSELVQLNICLQNESKALKKLNGELVKSVEEKETLVKTLNKHVEELSHAQVYDFNDIAKNLDCFTEPISTCETANEDQYTDESTILALKNVSSSYLWAADKNLIVVENGEEIFSQELPLTKECMKY